MSWELVLAAIGLAFVIEGLLPFMSPKRWRDMVAQIHKLQDGQIRFFGLGSIAIGLLLIWLA